MVATGALARSHIHRSLPDEHLHDRQRAGVGKQGPWCARGLLSAAGRDKLRGLYPDPAEEAGGPLHFCAMATVRIRSVFPAPRVPTLQRSRRSAGGASTTSPSRRQRGPGSMENIKGPTCPQSLVRAAVGHRAHAGGGQFSGRVMQARALLSAGQAQVLSQCRDGQGARRSVGGRLIRIAEFRPGVGPGEIQILPEAWDRLNKKCYRLRYGIGIVATGT